jgi:hypothetical protein
MIRVPALALLMTFGVAATALAAGRPAVPGPLPPPGVTAIQQAGKLCVADSAHFRVWWGDTPGRRFALEGADGRCETLPPVATETIQTAETFRTRAAQFGFPQLLGDGNPLYPRKVARARQLIRQKPAIRAAVLRAMSKAKRGPLLAGFSAAERRAVLQGLPGALRAEFKRDIAAALRGGPKVFVGGDRRLDIVLHASLEVLATTDGSSLCRHYRLANGKPSFRAASVLAFLPGPKANRGPLGRALFEAIECRMGLPRTNAALLREGVAEAMAAIVDPIGYAGFVRQLGPAQTPFGGAARAVGFCKRFDPYSLTVEDPQRSWAAWTALENAQPGIIRRTLTGTLRAPLTTPAAVLNQIGDASWSAALATGTQAVCGGLRSPFGQAFPAAIRGLITSVGTSATVSPTAPTTVEIPPGGVRTISATWGTAPAPTSVTLRASSPAFTGAALAAGAAASADDQLGVTSDATAVNAAVPAGSIARGAATITIANPSMRLPTSVNVQLVTTP